MNWNNVMGTAVLATMLAGCGVGVEDVSGDGQGSNGAPLTGGQSSCASHTDAQTCDATNHCSWIAVGAPCYVLPGQPPQCPGAGGSCIDEQLPPTTDGGTIVSGGGGSTGSTVDAGPPTSAPVFDCPALTSQASCAAQSACYWVPAGAPCYVLPGSTQTVCPGPSGACENATSQNPPPPGSK